MHAHDVVNRDSQRTLELYAREGSQEAFRRLQERYGALVRSAARARVKDDHLAEDVVQEVFLRLAQKAPNLSEGTLVSGWLIETTRRVSAEVIRKEARRRFRERRVASRMPEAARDSSDSSEDLRRLVRDALQDLRESDRQVLLLQYQQGLKLKEIAQLLGISTKSAGMRCSRAVDRLLVALNRRGASFAGAVGLSALLPSLLVPTALSSGAQAATVSGAAALGSLGSGGLLGALGVWLKTKLGILGWLGTAAAAGTLAVVTGIGIRSENSPGRSQAIAEIHTRESSAAAGWPKSAPALAREHEDLASPGAAEQASRPSEAASGPSEQPPTPRTQVSDLRTPSSVETPEKSPGRVTIRNAPLFLWISGLGGHVPPGAHNGLPYGGDGMKQVAMAFGLSMVSALSAWAQSAPPTLPPLPPSATDAIQSAQNALQAAENAAQQAIAAGQQAIQSGVQTLANGQKMVQDAQTLVQNLGANAPAAAQQGLAAATQALQAAQQTLQNGQQTVQNAQQSLTAAQQAAQAAFAAAQAAINQAQKAAGH